MGRRTGGPFCLFCCFTSQVNSYGHGRTVYRRPFKVPVKCVFLQEALKPHLTGTLINPNFILSNWMKESIHIQIKVLINRIF